ncbi:MAG TPA: aminoglycoside phosphotransferase family protein [Trueperaceae bacterium]|nr:aminoglycoside phosphotransferase family protein [Trueperaceae bacterium]
MSASGRLVPERVRRLAQRDPQGVAWLDALPGLVAELATRWRLRLGEPLQHEGYTAVVVPADLEDGTRAVLKLAFPHMEGRDEAAGLRFWDGDPTVRLLAHDEPSGAMLLERCLPGHSLHALPDERRDEVLASLVRRLWRRPQPGSGFRHLQEMIAYWAAETRGDEERWPDPALVREGLAAWEELARPSARDVLLGTDVHAGNVLAAEREPWLVIDPKPFVGDPAYDATQHLFDERERLAADPAGFVARWSASLGLPEDRVRAWTFARYAAERRDDDADWAEANALSRRLAPV